MNKELREQRKEYLDWVSLNKRKYLSGRFWQKELLECFKLWNKELKENKSFRDVFGKYIYKSILKKENLSFVKWKTYTELMSLFWKFNHFYDKYQKELENNLIAVDWNLKYNQKNTWKAIVNKLDYIEYLKNKLWEDFYKRIDKCLFENMNPIISSGSIYIELWNAIDDLGKELGIIISQEDRYTIRMVLSNRYDQEGNVDRDEID
jgi:hypothetical protein